MVMGCSIHYAKSIMQNSSEIVDFFFGGGTLNLIAMKQNMNGYTINPD